MSVRPLAAFCFDLLARLWEEEPRVQELEALAAAYRTDRAIEAAADLAETVVSYDQAQSGITSVREHALRTCVLMAQTWLATERAGMGVFKAGAGVQTEDAGEGEDDGNA